MSQVAVAEKMPDGVQMIRILDRAQWLGLRSQDITASVIGALVGVHDYATAYSLHMLKTGLIQEDAEETSAMRRGRLLEPVALQLIREQHPTWTLDAGTAYFRHCAWRIGATPDAFAIDPERPGFGIIQVKTVEPSIFRKKWRDEEGEIELPLWIACQAIVEATLTGASWVGVSPMRVGFGIDIDVIDVPLHAGLMGRLRAETETFWRGVDAGTPPAPDYGRDGAILSRLYGQDDGETIALDGDNMLPDLADEDERLANVIRDNTKRRKEIKAEVIAKLGSAAAATIDGRVVVTAKTSRRAAYKVPETTFRQIKFKRSA